MMRILMAGSIVLLVLLTACFPKVPQGEGEAVPRDLEGESVGVSSTPPTPIMDLEIATLVRKGALVDNYFYSFTEFIPGRGQEGYNAAIIGNKIKKTYQEPVKLSGDIFYDTVYMDLDAETAISICAGSGTVCRPHRNQAFAVDFSREKIVFTPVDILKDIPPSAQVAGTEVFDNRNALVVEYQTPSGKTEKVSIDRFYSLPLRREVYTQEDDRLVLQRKYTFTNINVGNVKNDEVALPAGYSLEE